MFGSAQIMSKNVLISAVHINKDYV